jgi:hypothetical protein
MKFSIATLLLLPALSAAFAPVQPRGASAIVSSLNGAKTFEEDLELTREVIAKFMESQGEEPTQKTEPKKEEAPKDE